MMAMRDRNYIVRAMRTAASLSYGYMLAYLLIGSGISSGETLPDSKKADGPSVATPGAASTASKWLPAALLNQMQITATKPRIPEPVAKALVCGKFELLFRMCVATDGHVSRLEPVRGPGSTDPKLLEELRHWQYKPQETPVCTMQQLHYNINPSDPKECELYRSHPRFLSPELTTPLKVSKGDEPASPTARRPGRPDAAHPAAQLSLYWMCVAGDGTVSDVIPLIDTDKTTKNTVLAIRRFEYQPTTFPFCTIYAVPKSGGNSISQFDLFQKIMFKTTDMAKQKLSTSNDDPHLPVDIKANHQGQTIKGSYLMCVNTAGVVKNIIALKSIPESDKGITEALMKWKYRPLATSGCFVQYLEFQIE